MSEPRRINLSDDEINVRLEVIKTLEVKLRKSDEIKSIKELIKEKEGIAQNVPKILLFAGTQLKDDKRMDHHGIDDFSTLQVFIPCSEESIFVKLPNGKIFDYIARSGDTVKKVKETIQAWEYIQLDGFKLVCDGKVLEDESLLAAANVKRNSLLNLVCCPKDKIHVYVCVPSGDALELNVERLFTVADVKEILGVMTGMPVNKQNLFIDGRHLEHSKTLAFYDVKEESVLELTSSFQIYIQLHNEEKVTFNVTKYSTVKDVIDTVKDCHFFKQHLYHGEIQLEDSRTLVSYEIKEYSILDLVPSYQIFVKTFYGGTITLDINKYDMLQDVKMKIYSKLNLPVDCQIIFFKGKLLEGKGKLVENGIQNHSSLNLELTLVRK